MLSRFVWDWPKRKPLPYTAFLTTRNIFSLHAFAWGWGCAALSLGVQRRKRRHLPTEPSSGILTFFTGRHLPSFLLLLELKTTLVLYCLLSFLVRGTCKLSLQSSLDPALYCTIPCYSLHQDEDDLSLPLGGSWWTSTLSSLESSHYQGNWTFLLAINSQKRASVGLVFACKPSLILLSFIFLSAVIDVTLVTRHSCDTSLLWL